MEDKMPASVSSKKNDRELEILKEEAKRYDTRALNGRMIEVVEGFGYDSDGNTYQKQSASLFPPRLGGWTCVNNRPLPTLIGCGPSKKVLKR